MSEADAAFGALHGLAHAIADHVQAIATDHPAHPFLSRMLLHAIADGLTKKPVRLFDWAWRAVNVVVIRHQSLRVLRVHFGLWREWRVPEALCVPTAAALREMAGE